MTDPQPDTHCDTCDRDLYARQVVPIYDDESGEFLGLGCECGELVDCGENYELARMFAKERKKVA